MNNLDKKADLPIRMRHVMQSDVPFIFNSWLESYRSSFFAKQIHPRTFYGEHHKIIGSLIQTCTTWVACSEADPNDIYGYICGEYQDGFLVVHYIYVKSTFRNWKIGTLLLQQFHVHESGVSFFTHLTRAADIQAAAYRMVYNPYLALNPKYREDKPNNGLDVTTKPKEPEDDRKQARHARRIADTKTNEGKD